MDKIIIITDFRPPKKGERYISTSNPKEFVITADNDMVLKWPIVGAEVEVPKGGHAFQYNFVNKDGCAIRLANNSSVCTGRIELSRPKVKKWVWQCGDLWITKEHFTEDEIHKRSNMPCLTKVPNSEIEVEE